MYYASYADTCRDKYDWIVVIKTKARTTITTPETNMEESFQEDDILEPAQIDQNEDLRGILQDFDGIVEEIDISNVVQEKEDDDVEEAFISENDDEELLSDDIDSDEYIQ